MAHIGLVHEIRAILAGDATDNFLLLDLCVHNSMYTKIEGEESGIKAR